MPEGTAAGVPNGLGDLVSSATNLGFALELYLKALRMQLCLPYRRTHDLWDLYMDLPDDVKLGIGKSYDESRRSLQPGVRGAITIAKGPVEPPRMVEIRRGAERP